MDNEKKTGNTRKWAQQLVHTDEELWKQVKVAAIMSGKTMTQWVEEVIRAKFDADAKKKSKE